MDFQFCPSCEQLNEPEAKRCTQCGADLTAAPALATEVPTAVAPAPPPPAGGAAAAGAAPSPAQALEEAIQANPKARALYLQLAQVYEGSGQVEQARATLERYLRVDPANAWVRQRLQALGRPATPGPVAPPHTLPRPLPPRPRWQRPVFIAGASLLLLAVGLGVKVLVFPSTRLLVSGSVDARAPRWAPRGDRVAFVSAAESKSTLSVYSLADGKVRDLAPLGYGGILAWSPDGQRIAYVSTVEEEDLYGEAVFAVDAAGGQPRRLAMGHNPSWSPDSIFLAMTCSGEEALARVRAAYQASLAYDEDGMAVAMEAPPMPAEATPGLCLVNAVNGDVTRLPAGSAGEVAFSPDGRRLAFAMQAEDTPETVAPSSEAAAGANQQTEFESFTEGVISHQPRNLAQGSNAISREVEARMYDKKNEAGGGLWADPGDLFVMTAEGSGLTRLPRRGRCAAPVWSADGGRIFYVVPAAKGAEIWAIASAGGSPERVFTLPVEAWDPQAVALSADGKRVVFPARVQANEGLARLMTGESPIDLHLMKAGEAKPRRLQNKHLFKQRFSLSPDGRRVVYEYRNEKTGKSELWMLRL